MAACVIIGSDHGGFELKERVKTFLHANGYTVIDKGTYSREACDYPDCVFPVVECISRGECNQGIVICTSGIGVSICANKVRGIRAALCTSVEQAELSRMHNDANVLALSARFTPPDVAVMICERWLETAFEGGRHARRVQKISEYEQRERMRKP